VTFALTAARRWAKTRRPSARVELVNEHGRWYAIVSGHHVSHLIRVRGGTLVGLGTTPADALRDCGDLLEAIDAAQRLDTTDGGW
jgi:hypothetical protein